MGGNDILNIFLKIFCFADKAMLAIYCRLSAIKTIQLVSQQLGY